MHCLAEEGPSGSGWLYRWDGAAFAVGAAPQTGDQHDRGCHSGCTGRYRYYSRAFIPDLRTFALWRSAELLAEFAPELLPVNVIDVSADPLSLKVRYLLDWIGRRLRAQMTF
jgi:hypothetical protein